ncbi:hypothetical protein ACFL5N_01175 [bacterium]
MAKKIFIMIFTVAALLRLPIFAEQVKDMFETYNFVPTYMSSFTTELSQDFSYNPGDYPTSIFFAIGDKLSQDIDLGLKEYLGLEVEVKIYKLEDKIRDEFFPYYEKESLRGVAVFYNEDLVGLWCVDTKAMFSVTGRNLFYIDFADSKWKKFLVKNKIFKKTARDKELRQLSPRGLIKEMMLGVKEKNLEKFYSCFTRQYVFKKLYSDFLDNYSLNHNFGKKIFVGDLNNIKNIEIKEMNSLSLTGADIAVYQVIFEIQGIDGSIKNKRFVVLLKKEIKNLGWRIEEIK